MKLPRRVVGVLVAIVTLCGWPDRLLVTSVGIDTALNRPANVYSCSANTSGTFAEAMSDPLHLQFKFLTKSIADLIAHLPVAHDEMVAVAYSITSSTFRSGSIKFHVDLLQTAASGGRPSLYTADELSILVHHYLARVNGTAGILIYDVRCADGRRLEFSVLPSTSPTSVDHFLVDYRLFIVEPYKSEYRNKSSPVYMTEAARLAKRFSYGFWRLQSGSLRALSFKINDLFSSPHTSGLGLKLTVAFSSTPGSHINASDFLAISVKAALRAKFLLNAYAVEGNVGHVTAVPTTSTTPTTPTSTTSRATTAASTTRAPTTAGSTSTTSTTRPPAARTSPLDTDSTLFTGNLTVQSAFSESLADQTSAAFRAKAEAIAGELARISVAGAEVVVRVVAVSGQPQSGGIVVHFDLYVVWTGVQGSISGPVMRQRIVNVFGSSSPVQSVEISGPAPVRVTPLPSSPPAGSRTHAVRFLAFLDEPFRAEFRVKSSPAYAQAAVRLIRQISFGLSRAAPPTALALRVNGLQPGSLGVDFSVSFEAKPGASFSANGLRRTCVSALVRGLFPVLSCAVPDFTPPTTSPPPDGPEPLTSVIVGVLGVLLAGSLAGVGLAIWWRMRRRPPTKSKTVARGSRVLWQSEYDSSHTVDCFYHSQPKEESEKGSVYSEIDDNSEGESNYSDLYDKPDEPPSDEEDPDTTAKGGLRADKDPGSDHPVNAYVAMETKPSTPYVAMETERSTPYVAMETE